MTRLSLLRPIGISLLAATTVVLAACGSSSSSDPASGGSSLPPDIQTRAELNCHGVDGPLDVLQTPLAEALTSGLGGQNAIAETVSGLGILVVDALDLVDAIAQTAATLSPGGTGDSAALLEPVVGALLCTTAAVGESVLELTLSATTPLAQRIELLGLLDIVVDLQKQLLDTVIVIGNGGTVPAVAGILEEVTHTLGVALGSPLGLDSLPGGPTIIGVLDPVSVLLLEVSHSLGTLGGGDEALFVDELLGAVSHLVDSLAATLGPLGVVLTTVVGLLAPVVSILDNLLTGLLGLLG